MSTSVKIIGEIQNDHGKWLPLNQEIVHKFWEEQSQNYTTFCALAGIRREDAEKRVGRPVLSIAKNRGLPKDWIIQKEVDGNIPGLGYQPHSITWMTITEIMAYDWASLGEESQNLGKKPWKFGPTEPNTIKYD